MTEEEWTNGFTRCLGLRLAGDAIEEVDRAGEPIRDDTFLLLFNAHTSRSTSSLPAHRTRVRWELVLDTRDWAPRAAGVPRRRSSIRWRRAASPCSACGARAQRAVDGAHAPRTGSSSAPASTFARRPRARPLPGGARDQPTATSRRSSSPCARDSHGYDVVDHGRLNDGAGRTRPATRRCAEALRAHGMGLLVDVVPEPHGHRRAAERLVAGRARERRGLAVRVASSTSTGSPLKPELRNRVLLPILGDHYGRVLEQAELRLQYEDGALPRPLLRARVLPIDPRTLPRILAVPARRARGPAGTEPTRTSWSSGASWPRRRLPRRTGPTRTGASGRRVGATRRSSSAGWTRLVARVARGEGARRGRGLARERQVPASRRASTGSTPCSSAQAYRVAYWGVAGDEINYRRFFDINDLAAIRMEDPAVFEAAHRLLLDLVGEGRITGLRIDHPDGLYTPARYLESLRAACAERSRGRGGPRRRPLLSTSWSRRS